MNTRDMYKNIYSSVFSHREIPPPTKKVRIAKADITTHILEWINMVDSY